MDTCLRCSTASAPHATPHQRTTHGWPPCATAAAHSSARRWTGPGNGLPGRSSGVAPVAPCRSPAFRGCRTTTSRGAAVAAAATEQAPVAERLSGEDAEQWAACLEEVTKVGYSEEDANALLERAFGWRTQTFWRGLKKEEVPKAESVAATLNFLRELGMKDEDIQAAFKKFPEGLASDMEARLKPNMQTLQKDYYIPEKNLLAAVKRQPKALGFSYDCEGSCEGECHRCWVRF